uniref:Uncharacterized protein n=1 Tax=Arion vulgaris TaxID=1028688 RepID=A0A0B6ZZH2_9EUPU
MAVNVTTAEEQLTNLALFVMNVNMFPVFFTAHFAMASIIVREDSKDLGTRFRQNHPFATWVCTVVTSVSGVFLANFLFGDPLIDILKDNTLVIFITVLWYLINYSPFDIVFKVAMFRPVFLLASSLQECLRIRFIYLGVLQAAKVYPGGYVIIIIGGVIKGNGYGFIKIVERLMRGKFTPTTNDLLDVTYFAKSSLYASVLFLLHHIKVLTMPIELLYFGIVATFVLLRLVIILGGIKDPLLPLESPIYTLLFGSGVEKKDKAEQGNTEKTEKVTKDTDNDKKEKKTK